MRHGPDIVRTASLIGDPARANILTALMSGKALTATELALEAGVTPQTASSHLSRLTEGGLVIAEKQGRHRYVRLASDQVAEVLEALMGLAAGTGQLRHRPGPKDAQLRAARVCYDHLAGDRGVQLWDGLHTRGWLVQGAELPELTPEGRDWARRFGIDLDLLEKGRAPMCRPCLDWSERRHHLGGKLGRALLARMEERGWMMRQAGGRALRLTEAGVRGLDALAG